ncbi:MAG: phosphoribosylformylglycinamidine cyclo-ligase [bacterium]
MKRPVTYAGAGVDAALGDQLVEWIRKRAPKIGGFGGLFPLPGGYKKPVLVASTDGVGTKLLLAERLGRHETVGIDLVAMVVNDLVVSGAKPLFFLDYYATGKLRLEHGQKVLKGILKGCEEAGCELLGGETAELPGMYEGERYDLAGFGVGIVEADEVIDGSGIWAGDVLVGLPSSGLHSNGYSLVRKIVFETAPQDLGSRPEGFEKTLGKILLEPTRIYVKPVLAALERVKIKGMAHITGEGIAGNLVRILPLNVDAVVDLGKWERPRVFGWLQEVGGIEEAEMRGTFNLGVGMMVVVGKKDVAEAREVFRESGLKAVVIGEVVEGAGKVILKPEMNPGGRG